MILVAIDPGVHMSGYAIFEGQALRDCGWCSTLLGPRVIGPHHVIVELPQIYPQRKWKGDPNDLINVAFAAGWQAGRATSFSTVKPHAWKGSTPKTVMTERIRSSLTQPEVILSGGLIGSIEKSVRHNVIDAIGIGLWKLGRLKKS